MQQNGCDLATGEGCAAGLECWQHNGVGVCLESCNFFSDPACAGGNACAPVSVDGGGYCTPAGPGGVGSLCETQADCGANLYCVDDGVGNKSCRTLCDTENAAACPGETCHVLREKDSAGSARFADHVMAAERIENAQLALGVITPLAIHHKAVGMLARRQSHRDLPHPVLVLAQGKATSLPMREIPHQQHAHGPRRGKTKGLRSSGFR